MWKFDALVKVSVEATVDVGRPCRQMETYTVYETRAAPNQSAMSGALFPTCHLRWVS